MTKHTTMNTRATHYTQRLLNVSLRQPIRTIYLAADGVVSIVDFNMFSFLGSLSLVFICCCIHIKRFAMNAQIVVVILFTLSVPFYFSGLYSKLRLLSRCCYWCCCCCWLQYVEWLNNLWPIHNTYQLCRIIVFIYRLFTYTHTSTHVLLYHNAVVVRCMTVCCRWPFLSHM